MRFSYLLMAIGGITLALLLILTGCAGGAKMQSTEEGYMPTHVAVGEIIAYTGGVAQVSTSDLYEMINEYLEMAFRSQGLRYIPLAELEKTGIDKANIVKMNATVTFQQGASDIAQSTDARISYNLVRASDGFLWQEGSAKTTDWSVSQGATVDVQNAIKFAAQAAATDMKVLMKK